MVNKSVIYLIIILFFVECTNRGISPLVENELSTFKTSQTDSNQLAEAETLGWTSWFRNQKHGNLFITNYSLDENMDKQIWAIAQDNNNVMLFANRKGILAYDGNDLTNIKTTTFPYSIYKDNSSNIIYVGCSNSIGYLQKDEDGTYNYVSIIDNSDLGNIVSILQLGDHIYFASSETITKVNAKNTEDYTTIFSADDNFFTGIFALKNKIFVNSYPNGIQTLDNDAVKPFSPQKWDANLPLDTTVIRIMNEGYNLENMDLVFQIAYNDDNVLLGTSDNHLYLFDGNGFARYDSEAYSYLKDNVISGGLNISKTEFAVSTLEGGCIIIEKTTGKVITTINYQSGLPDEEIYSMGLDANKGLWLSHPYGVSRVSLTLPVTSYSSYLGMEGNITFIEQVDTSLYVATTEGVFYLTQVKDYKEVEVLVKKRKEQKLYSPQKTVNIYDKNNEDIHESRPVEKTDLENEQDEKNNDSKWLQSKWKKIKNKLKKDEKIPPKDNQDNSKELATKQDTVKTNLAKPDKQTDKEKIKPVVKTIVRTEIVPVIEYQLQSVSYIFKKIEGINTKCKQLYRFGDKLLVITNNGLYEITQNVAKPILIDIYTNVITQSSEPNVFYLGASEGFYKIIYSETDGKWTNTKMSDDIGNEFDEPIYSIIEMQTAGDLWLGGENKAFHANFKDNPLPSIDSYTFYNDFPERIIARKANNKPVFYLLSGIYGFDEENDIIFKQILYPDFIPNVRYVTTQEQITWLLKDDDYKALMQDSTNEELQLPYFGLFDNIQNIFVDNKQNIWIVDNYSALYKIIPEKNYQVNNFTIHVKSISNSEGNLLSTKNIELDYKNNAIEMQVSAPYFVKAVTATQYKHFVAGMSNEWTEWTTENGINYPYIPPGKYTVYVRAKNLFGQYSNIETFKLTVTPPFWQQTWFFGIVAALLLVGIYFIIKRRERKLQIENSILEEKVLVRTEQIRKQQRHITDSILYAGRIQRAILPPKDLSDKILPQHFILNLPRDIVSGDYYWFTRKNNKVIVVAADCTGHGVPGAFLSMLGVTLLNDIVSKRDVLNPSKILDHLREDVMRSLHQTGERGGSKDGMDIAICVLDTEKHTLEYAGAHNPLVLFKRKSEETVETAIIVSNDTENDADEIIESTDYDLIEVKADRMPIGIYLKDRKFTNHEMLINQGDTFYIFSDGYADQFGEEENRKFYMKRFKQLLLSIQEQPMSLQKDILHETHEKWKGKVEQVDDILVIGVRYGI